MTPILDMLPLDPGEESGVQFDISQGQNFQGEGWAEDMI